MNTYKDQFTEWSPAYPVVFHGSSFELDGCSFSDAGFVNWQTLKTHSITINEINKAMKK